MNSSLHIVPPRAQSRALGLHVQAPLWERRRRVLAVGFLLVWPAFYSSFGHAVPSSAPMSLRLGKSATFPLPPGAKWSIEEGAANVRCQGENGALTISAVSTGLAKVRVETADGKVELISLRFISPEYKATEASPTTDQLVSRRAVSQVTPAPNDPLLEIPAIPSNLGGAPTRVPAAGSAAPGVNPANAPAGFPNGGATINPPAGFPGGLPRLEGTLPAPATSPNVLTSPEDNGNGTSLPPTLPILPAVRPTPRPAQNTTRPNPTSVQNTGPQVQRDLPTAPTTTERTTRISPILPAPSRVKNANVSYRTTPRLPQNVSTNGPRPGISVTQGLARLVSFPDNILSVFFSDPAVMDARAINARTIAVTGTGAGVSTLAVFTSRYPGDAVGRANVYRVQTAGRAGAPGATNLSRDPQVVEAAVTAALGDPRVRTSVVRLPDGSLAARLTGTVRNAAEVEGAQNTASFYVSRVLSSLYADVNAPTIDAVLSLTAPATPDSTLQATLRRLTGNDSIELISLPGGLALKAVTESAEEAESLLRVLPSLNQAVTPFIVVRGLATAQNPYLNGSIPFLQGEDRQLTDRLQSVTGVRTVYAVRASGNSVAIYGSVRTRSDYESVKRFGLVIAQTAVAAIAGTTQGGQTLRPTGGEIALPAYDPAGGYLRPLGVQMFVKILDPSQAVVRNVTVETSVVEISRTALRNLGAQFGSSALTGETVVRDPVSGIDTVTRVINPNFVQGQTLAGNGFAGFGRSGENGALGFINPFRVQLNALENRGDARVLSRPNVSAIEGMPAQITIGGERPVPSSSSTTTTVSQNIEFRRFGVIISMRPTVADDNTIFLQIRADITQPDRTFEINLNGALIPGESVRSVDTSLVVRPGDVIVMGGLITNEKRQLTSKVPILGNLPVIGSLFRSKRFENNETELAIFMQPRIEALPATENLREIVGRGPGFPALPSRQEGNGVLFQNSTRAPG